jgi:DNA-binding CsgD family transcriptional regulator
VREVAADLGVDIFLDLVPVIFVVPDALAVGADGNELFEFTPAESAVATTLMNGFPPAEIARSLDLSVFTVRNHLKRMYSKTNTGNQCELLHLLLHTPASLRF